MIKEKEELYNVLRLLYEENGEKIDQDLIRDRYDERFGGREEYMVYLLITLKVLGLVNEEFIVKKNYYSITESGKSLMENE